MNRGQLAFLVLVNTMVSLVIALAVVWAFEVRRPDPEELAAINTPQPEPVLAVSPADPTATPDADMPTTAPEAVATATSTPEPTVEPTVYVVQPGDTMLVIATRYNISVDDILNANNLSDPNFVFAGQRLVIPVQGSGTVTDVVSNAAPEGEPTATPIIEGVRITEISSPGDLANEQAIIVNEGNAPFTLQGWQLQRAEGPSYTFLSDVPLFPGGSVRLHSAEGSDTTIDLYWGLTEPVWQSDAEARLLNAQGDVVSTYTVP